MPKQVKDKNKSTRMMFVKEAIEKHGKCSHKEISQYVASKIEADISDKNFKKAVYNDLDSLIGDNIVGIEYRTRAGDLIPIGEEEDYKNKRNSFYFILGDESETEGAGLFKKMGVRFQPQKLLSPEWKISDVKNKHLPSTEKICILFRINGKYHCLETEKLEVPFTIVVAGEGDYVPSHDDLEKEFESNRVSFISIANEYLEKATKDERLGHFYITVDMNFDEEIECTVDYVVSRSDKKLIEEKIKKNQSAWDNASKLKNQEYEEIKKVLNFIYDFREENELSDLDELSDTNKKTIVDNIPKKYEQCVEKLNTIEQLKQILSEGYKASCNEFEKINTLSRLEYDDVQLTKITYSRVNDFIDDANAKSRLRLPSSNLDGLAKNIGEKNRFHARKPPQRKKSAAKYDLSKMESTENFFIWSNLQGSCEELPINIKVGAQFQIVISDFYPDSSYSKSELEKMYKTKKKKAA